MHHRMYRLFRTIQTPSCRRLSTRSNPFSGSGNGAKIPKTLKIVAPVGGATFMLGGAILFNQKNEKDAIQETEAPIEKPRIYSLGELGALCEKGKIVVAYRGGLYDMTDFTGHPGGVGRLQMAAGNDVEVYWKVYMQHNRGHIYEHMKPYRIGEVSASDMATITSNTYYDSSAYDSTPTYPDLLVNTRYPYNAEGKLSELTDNWQTPIGKHFVRNHCAVPVVDPEEYCLTICGEDVSETEFTLEDLKTKFEKVDVTTVIQCNGNRREDFHYVDGKTPAFGPPHWVAGAMGNSTWSGPRLRDVLRASGMDVDAISLGKKEVPLSWNVGLLGMDQDEVGNQYCCSFPFDKAVDPFGDVILAYEMNGEPIPRSHGYPVRAIIPGHAGARNCKFLERVTITDNACKGDSNWKQYAVHAQDVTVEKIANFNLHKPELMADPPVQEMPVQSLITTPSPNDILSAIKSGCESISVKGIAWGGGGRGVNRVDVSLDNGKNFTRAEMLEKPVEHKRKSEWSWTFFEKTIPLPEDLRQKLQDGEKVELTLTSKAFNSAWNVQPENPNYNAHGCCVNHWYRVPITVSPTTPEDIKFKGEFGNSPSGGKFTAPFRNLESPDMLRQREAEGFKIQIEN